MKRFKSAGWAATRIDGHDPDAIAKAITAAQKSDKPSMIACRTTIGFGAPNKGGTEKAHGSPLGAEEIAAARKKLGWTSPPFEIPPGILDQWRAAGERGKPAARLGAAPRRARSGKRAEFERRLRATFGQAHRRRCNEVKEKLATDAEGNRQPQRRKTRSIPFTGDCRK